MSLGIHRHLRHRPRQGASRRSSTGLYGPVAAGAPACPRPRPCLCTPAHLVPACGAHVARCVRPPMSKTPQYLSPLPPCACSCRRNASCTSSGRALNLLQLRFGPPPYGQEIGVPTPRLCSPTATVSNGGYCTSTVVQMATPEHRRGRPDPVGWRNRPGLGVTGPRGRPRSLRRRASAGLRGGLET